MGPREHRGRAAFLRYCRKSRLSSGRSSAGTFGQRTPKRRRAGTGIYFGSSFSETELMQYRIPVGRGPSGKT